MMSNVPYTFPCKKTVCLFWNDFSCVSHYERIYDGVPLPLNLQRRNNLAFIALGENEELHKNKQTQKRIILTHARIHK